MPIVQRFQSSRREIVTLMNLIIIIHYIILYYTSTNIFISHSGSHPHGHLSHLVYILYYAAKCQVQSFTILYCYSHLQNYSTICHIWSYYYSLQQQCTYKDENNVFHLFPLGYYNKHLGTYFTRLFTRAGTQIKLMIQL